MEIKNWSRVLRGDAADESAAVVAPRGNARRFALFVNGRFLEITAGLLRHSAKAQDKGADWHYFGSGQVVRRGQSGGMVHTFSAVRMLGDGGQEAVLACLQECGGRAVPLLVWYGGMPAGSADIYGNGFQCEALVAVEDDGNGGAGTVGQMRFSLTECGPRQAGRVFAQEDGALSFAAVGAAARRDG